MNITNSSITNCIVGFYASTPQGTEKKELENYYQRCLKPLIAEIYKHKNIIFTLYLSSNLLEYIYKKHSEFNMVLSELFNRKQLELLGGAIAEAGLPLIPRTDRSGQLEAMTTLIRKNYGKRPRGAWLPSFVWEPSLAFTLANNGLEFTFLEERQFNLAGVSSVYNPALTEDQGKVLTVYPVHSNIFEQIDSENEADFVNFIKSKAQGGLYGMMLPADYLADNSDRIYKKALLHRILNAFKEDDDIYVIQPNKFARASGVLHRSYFPTSASSEIEIAAFDKTRKLSEKDKRDIIQGKRTGGFIRQFLGQYTDINLLYSKMQYTHILINQIKADKQRKNAAREDLWFGQYIGAFLPGEGINRKTRSYSYSRLIKAEAATRQRGIFIPSIVNTDFDLDGQNEYLYSGKNLNAYLHNQGGMLFELDHIPSAWNYCDCVSNGKIKRSFQDSILDSSDPGQRIYLGQDTYDLQKCYRERCEVVFSLNKVLKTPSGTKKEIELSKRFFLKQDVINVYYSIKNPSPFPLNLEFAVDLNLNFASGTDYEIIGVEKDRSEGDEMTIGEAFETLFVDPEKSTIINLASTESAYYTVKDSFASDQYAGTKVRLSYRLSLEPNGVWDNRISLNITSK